MADKKEGGGGTDAMTFLVGLVILGALAQVAYAQFAKLGTPANNTAPQEKTATSTPAANIGD